MALSDSDDDDEEEEEKPESDRKGGAGAGATAAGGSPSKRRQTARAAADETIDADGEDKAPTYLVQQPPSISGGTMRSYQLEGLNWMINLQAQGTNGEWAAPVSYPEIFLLIVYSGIMYF